MLIDNYQKRRKRVDVRNNISHKKVVEWFQSTRILLLLGRGRGEIERGTLICNGKMGKRQIFSTSARNVWAENGNRMVLQEVHSIL